MISGVMKCFPYPTLSYRCYRTCPHQIWSRLVNLVAFEKLKMYKCYIKWQTDLLKSKLYRLLFRFFFIFLNNNQNKKGACEGLIQIWQMLINGWWQTNTYRKRSTGWPRSHKIFKSQFMYILKLYIFSLTLFYIYRWNIIFYCM